MNLLSSTVSICADSRKKTQSPSMDPSIMRTVIQRVSSAKVEVNGNTIGSISKGLVVLLGIENGDTQREGQWLAEKIANLRIFEDEKGNMNDSALVTRGSILIVSQFTLLADCQHGRRPAFTNAAEPSLAKPLYLAFIASVKQLGLNVQTGEFGADMQLTLTNDGPVTILLERAHH